jgi:N-methylhydantoinase B
MPDDHDPFLLEILKNGFDTIADQMALTLMRTAYSSIVRDTMDFSTAVCDAQGRTLAQGLTVPQQLGSFHDAMLCLLERFDGRINQGDVFIFNDPYDSAGQHLPDIYIIKPIFFDGGLQGFATTIAHHADVGGIVPGSNALGATEIIQEGLRIPIVKFADKDGPVQPVWDIVRLNVRVPEKVLGDLQAQMAACNAGEREVTALYERYGVDTMSAYIEHLHDYAERLARAGIAHIPDGTYAFTDTIEGLGTSGKTNVLKVKITIDGSEVLIDWEGTSPQVRGGINSVLSYTKAAAYCAIRSVIPAEVPNCHGYTRPITVVAPEASLVNPVYPGPVGARGITGYRMIDCLFGALAQAVPDKVTADTSGGASLPTIGGWHEGAPFVFCETVMGNWGGTATHDGQEGVAHLGANAANVPVEMVEVNHPLRIECYGFVPDTGGPGRFRGGLAIVRDYRLLADEAILTMRSDKREFPPHGLFGGHTGAPSLNVINPGTEDIVLPVLPTEPWPLRKGDVFRHIMAGGGGYGDPLERDPERVLDDFREDRITKDHAEKSYGVIVRDSRPARVDMKATRALRRRLCAEASAAAG